LQKERLDKLLVQRQLATTRERAQELIAAGRVMVGHIPASKSGTWVRLDVDVHVTSDGPHYVGRGANKLAGAHVSFGFSPLGRVAMDVGISTGGFTDYLLQNGALAVVGIDVGYGQLDFRLRQDPRVCLLERTNARQLTPQVLNASLSPLAKSAPIDLVVMDLSFISVTKVLPHIATLVAPSSDFVILIKPQFEAERHEVGKGGIISDEDLRQRIFTRVEMALSDVFVLQARCDSPISGTKGNREAFFWLRTKG
jgi:23S rRNA (cytidine1920-2'-O)/16S rRNA (cytidine1409-2'-O)-methyltransferase